MGGYGLHHNGNTATPIVESFFKMLFDCLNQINDHVEVKVGLEDNRWMLPGSQSQEEAQCPIRCAR